VHEDSDDDKEGGLLLSAAAVSGVIIIIIYSLKSTEQADAHMINKRTRAGQERHRKMALTFCP